MKKEISFSSQGHRADIGEYIINRILPNRYADAVGPFVFLDHALPIKHSPDEPHKVANGKGAHPHRGIATLTYILNGEADHLDSSGHHAKVRSGGAQWMKAGNGIIHDEVMNVDPEKSDLLTHAFQFWINLPSKQKAEPPEYVSVQAGEVQTQKLSDKRGWLKVIVGEFENLRSKIPNYSKQFLYHIHLEAGKRFSIETNEKIDYAVFLPSNKVAVNDIEFQAGKLIVFTSHGEIIELYNSGETATDII